MQRLELIDILETMKIEVKSKEEAWRLARKILQADCDIISERSEKAGYLFFCSLGNPNDYVRDLENRLEINFCRENKTIDIWILEEKRHSLTGKVLTE